jgi:hypothetical protein
VQEDSGEEEPIVGAFGIHVGEARHLHVACVTWPRGAYGTGCCHSNSTPSGQVTLGKYKRGTYLEPPPPGGSK